MEILCRCCHEFFTPCDDTLDLIAEGYLSSDSVNCCDDCFEMLKYSEYEQYDTYSDADPGL